MDRPVAARWPHAVAQLTPKEALTLLRAFEALEHNAASVAGVPDAQPQAALLQSLASALPRARGLAAGWLRELNAEACETGRAADVFANDAVRAPAVAKRKRDIERCHADLDDHLQDVRRLLGRADAQYRSVSGTEACGRRCPPRRGAPPASVQTSDA